MMSLTHSKWTNILGSTIRYHLKLEAFVRDEFRNYLERFKSKIELHCPRAVHAF